MKARPSECCPKWCDRCVRKSARFRDISTRWRLISWDAPRSTHRNADNRHPLSYVGLAAQKRDYSLNLHGCCGFRAISRIGRPAARPRRSHHQQTLGRAFHLQICEGLSGSLVGPCQMRSLAGRPAGRPLLGFRVRGGGSMRLHGPLPGRDRTPIGYSRTHRCSGTRPGSTRQSRSPGRGTIGEDPLHSATFTHPGRSVNITVPFGFTPQFRMAYW